jgi:hypothetical protein
VYDEIFTCKSRDLPSKYLGVPIHKKRLLEPAKDKMEKRLGCYQGKLLVMGSRVNLLNACLSTYLST